MNKEKIIFIVLRLVLGFIFLWAFVDKVFGLGFATASSKAWIHGASPTAGFLMFFLTGLQVFYNRIYRYILVNSHKIVFCVFRVFALTFDYWNIRF
jgi:uncharacterized membrane protein YphA (DoxX/SURF4 family)